MAQRHSLGATRWAIHRKNIPTANIPGDSSPGIALRYGWNGDLLVADAGAGIQVVRNDVVRSTIELPGATDVSALGRGSMWVTSAGADPLVDSGQALWRVSNGKARMVVNLFEFEQTVNPDGNDPPDSNPFDVQSLGGRSSLVVDAGGNDLLRINNRGDVDVLAVFPEELVSTANLKALAGCPEGPPPFCGLPDEIPAEAVPTSVAVGPDGWYYVGDLKGFPAPTDESSIWKVSPDAGGEMCPNAHCVKVFDGGFTSIIDLAFGSDGNLYVAELDEASWASVEIFETVTGGSVTSCDVTSLTCNPVASDIPILTAITFGTDGTLWATRNALIPGQGEVVAID